MNAGIWRRLLWKEWRSAWPVALAGTLLPLLTAVAINRIRASTGVWNVNIADVIYPVAAITSILVMLWVVERVRRPERERLALPVPFRVEWVVTHLAPLPVAALVGAAVGVMLMPLDLANLADIVFIGIAYLAATCTLMTTIGQLLPMVPTVLVGVAWLFLGFDPGRLAHNGPFFLAVILLSWLLSLLRSPLARRPGRHLGVRIAVTVGLLLLMAAPLLVEEVGDRWEGLHVFAEPRIAAASGQGYLFAELTSMDRTLVVYPITEKHTGMVFRDLRNSRKVVSLQGGGLGLGFLGRTGVLFAAQDDGDRNRLLLRVWDTRTNVIRPLMSLPALPTADIRALISPSGRYAVLGASSRLGTALNDYWALDLVAKRARLVLPGAPVWYYEDGFAASGRDDRFIFFIAGRLVMIDLRAMTAQTVPLRPGRAGR
jgi:hypothetical protein